MVEFQLSDLPPMGRPVIAGVAVLVGGLAVVFGDRLFRMLMGISGFLAGALVAGLLMHGTMPPHPMLSVAGALVGGILCGALCYAVYKVGLFVLGAGLGAVISGSVLSLLGVPPSAGTLLAPGAFSGLLTVLVQRLAVVVGTSVLGGLMVAVGGIVLLGDLDILRRYLDPWTLGRQDLLWLGGALILAVIGIVLQYTVTARRPAAEPEDAEGEMPVTIHPPSRPGDGLHGLDDAQLARDLVPGLAALQGGEATPRSASAAQQAGAENGSSNSEVAAAIADALVSVETAESDDGSGDTFDAGVAPPDKRPDGAEGPAEIHDDAVAGWEIASDEESGR